MNEARRPITHSRRFAAVGRRLLAGGVGFALAVWSASLVQVPASPPVWEYSMSELLPDFAFHLVDGASVGAAFRVLD